MPSREVPVQLRKTTVEPMAPESVQSLKGRLGAREKGAGKGLIVRKSRLGGERTLRKMAIYLPADEGDRLDHYCVTVRRERSSVVAEAVAAFLNRKAPK